MAREIIASVEPYETRVAVIEDGTLVNIFVERGEPLAGNIYKGKVVNVLPGMEAAFVDIGLDRNAFLHVTDIRSQRLVGEEVDESFGRGAIADRLRPGQEILVQVTKEPLGTKGARVTPYIALPAHYLVLMPTVNYVGVSRRIEGDTERKRLRQIADSIKPDKMGVIVRTAAEGGGGFYPPRRRGWSDSRSALLVRPGPEVARPPPQGGGADLRALRRGKGTGAGAAAQGLVTLRRLHRHRPHGGAHRHRRQHREVRWQDRSGQHDLQDQPGGGRRDRAPDHPAGHRRHYPGGSYRHGERAGPQGGPR